MVKWIIDSKISGKINNKYLENATDAICEPFVSPPGKGYSGVCSRPPRLYGRKNVAKTLENVYPNPTSRDNLTTNDSVLSEISGIDSDNITMNFVAQILTEKKGGSLDARKCFLFLRIHGFGVRHLTLPSYSGI